MNRNDKILLISNILGYRTDDIENWSDTRIEEYYQQAYRIVKEYYYD